MKSTPWRQLSGIFNTWVGFSAKTIPLFRTYYYLPKHRIPVPGENNNRAPKGVVMNSTDWEWLQDLFHTGLHLSPENRAILLAERGKEHPGEMISCKLNAFQK